MTRAHRPFRTRPTRARSNSRSCCCRSMAGVLMQALDTTIANVALPYMQGSLSASRDQITWVLTSYIIAAAIMTAPVGWIASRFGKQATSLVIARRLHRHLDDVRRRAVAGADDPVPPAAGRVRRRAGAAVAGGDARPLSAAEARQR